MGTHLFNFVAKYWLLILEFMIIGYIFGSLNTPIIITKIFSRGTDIRNMESGNAGFANVLRCMGKWVAILVFVVDILKIFLAMFYVKLRVSYIAPSYLIYFLYIMGISGLIGNLYPCFFRFQGGKGILFSLAMILFINYRIAIILLSIFIIVTLISKMISLGSILAAFFHPIVTFYLYYAQKKYTINTIMYVTILSSIMSSIIIYRHKENIKRILNKTERKVFIKKQGKV